MLMGEGLDPSAASQFFLPFIFNQVLDRTHAVLKHRYLLKLELGRPRTPMELMADSKGDYHAFLEALSDAIAYIDFMDAGRLDDVNAWRGSHILIGQRVFPAEEYEVACVKPVDDEPRDRFKMSDNLCFHFCSPDCEEDCLCVNNRIAEKLGFYKSRL
ncbi:hypothetical protein NLJ89_g12328 [Agrocybe chaxingu]|uniref:Uncharacterized protein n=1 Tax=Agrocybe chaxingu TaxID=84603 RepID=A0A9W8MNL0_9AGAR|nr:hypothetical protein NLJ89_g12328 [Agrocybe chaxingu]